MNSESKRADFGLDEIGLGGYVIKRTRGESMWIDELGQSICFTINLQFMCLSSPTGHTFHQFQLEDTGDGGEKGIKFRGFVG